MSSPQAPLRDQRALVTGATSGIGLATAHALAAAGAKVTLAGRRAERLNTAAAQLEGSSVLELDVRDGAAVRAALEPLEFDVVVANAGLAKGTELVQDAAADDWDAMLDTNVKGLLHTVRGCLPKMLERGSGDVILIGSVAGRSVYPGGSVYCASKHAVRAIYEGLRQDAGGRGVRFTTVDPGLVQTEFSEVRFDGDTEKAAGVYQGYRPLAPDDIARTIRFALEQPRHVNLGEIVIWPTDQISTTRVVKEGQ